MQLADNEVIKYLKPKSIIGAKNAWISPMGNCYIIGESQHNYIASVICENEIDILNMHGIYYECILEEVGWLKLQRKKFLYKKLGLPTNKQIDLIIEYWLAMEKQKYIYNETQFKTIQDFFKYLAGANI